MNKSGFSLVNIIKRKILFILIIIVLPFVFIYFLKPSVESIISNYSTKNNLQTEIESKNKELESIIAENKRKTEAAKKATVKEFFKLKGNDDVRVAYAPMFENIITMIKQNGLRMKSIKYTNAIPEDSLVKNGGGAYQGCQVDFQLVGYYQQFAEFLNEIDVYPYFISINKFKVTPYQYDNKILIADVSIIFYSKR